MNIDIPYNRAVPTDGLWVRVGTNWSALTPWVVVAAAGVAVLIGFSLWLKRRGHLPTLSDAAFVAIIMGALFTGIVMSVGFVRTPSAGEFESSLPAGATRTGASTATVGIGTYEHVTTLTSDQVRQFNRDYYPSGGYSVNDVDLRAMDAALRRAIPQTYNVTITGQDLIYADTDTDFDATIGGKPQICRVQVDSRTGSDFFHRPTAEHAIVRCRPNPDAYVEPARNAR